jgi:hypothetical protein
MDTERNIELLRRRQEPLVDRLIEIVTLGLAVDWRAEETQLADCPPQLGDRGLRCPHRQHREAAGVGPRSGVGARSLGSDGRRR